MGTPYSFGLLPIYWLFHLNLTYYYSLSNYPQTDDFRISISIFPGFHKEWKSTRSPTGLNDTSHKLSKSKTKRIIFSPKLICSQQSFSSANGTNIDSMAQARNQGTFLPQVPYSLNLSTSLPSSSSLSSLIKITSLPNGLPEFTLIPSNPLSTVKSQYYFKITCMIMSLLQGFPTRQDKFEAT